MNNAPQLLTIRILRDLCNAARAEGVETIAVADIERCITDIETTGTALHNQPAPISTP